MGTQRHDLVGVKPEHATSITEFVAEFRRLYRWHEAPSLDMAQMTQKLSQKFLDEHKLAFPAFMANGCTQVPDGGSRAVIMSWEHMYRTFFSPQVDNSVHWYDQNLLNHIMGSISLYIAKHYYLEVIMNEDRKPGLNSGERVQYAFKSPRMEIALYYGRGGGNTLYAIAKKIAGVRNSLLADPKESDSFFLVEENDFGEFQSLLAKSKELSDPEIQSHLHDLMQGNSIVCCFSNFYVEYD